MQLAGGAGAPVIGFIESAGARMQEGLAALGGFGRIFSENVALSGTVPQISIVTGVSAGGGSLLARADRLRADGRGREHVPHRPGSRARGDRRGRDARRARRHARARAQRRLRPGGAPTSSSAADTRALAARATSAQARDGAGGSAGRPTPGALVPHAARKTYDMRDVIRSVSDGGEFLELSAALGAQHGHGLLPDRGPARRRGREPAALPRRRDRLDRLARRRRASCARATRSGCRWSCSSTRPGSCPACRQESAGVIRHGASLLRRVRGGAACRG